MSSFTGFSAAIVGAAGVEVAQELSAPLLQGPCGAGNLGHWSDVSESMRRAGEHQIPALPASPVKIVRRRLVARCIRFLAVSSLTWSRSAISASPRPWTYLR